MGVKYDKYLARLREKRLNNPEYAFYRQTMQGMTEPLKRINYETQGRMTGAGGSIGAVAQAGLTAQQNYMNTASNLYQTANRNAIARNDKLDTQIMNLEAQRDAERDAGKDAGLKGILSIGGTALGAAAGTIIAPGAGTMIGAQIGSALGGTAGSFVGNGGQMALDNLNLAELEQGIGDTIAGFSAMSTLQDDRELGDLLKTKLPLLTGDKLTSFITLLETGNIKAAIELLRELEEVAPGLNYDAENNVLMNDAMAGVGV